MTTAKQKELERVRQIVETIRKGREQRAKLEYQGAHVRDCNCAGCGRGR